MKISCIMSNYNTPEQYLRESIESILNQSFKDFELIIIDDGSTDRSPEVIKEYVDKDSRVILIENGKNYGLPHSLNRGIDIAQGTYIARMDTDDISLPDRFMTQSEYLDSHADIDIVGSFTLCFGNQKGYSITPFFDSDHCKCSMLYASSIPHPTVMIRRSFLNEHKLRYNEEFLSAQDLELWSRCLEYGKIEIIDSILLLYRIHGKQISIEKREQQKYFVKRTCKKQISSHIKKNVTDDEMELHLILSGYNIINTKNASDLRKWIQTLIDNNKGYYDPHCLKEILNYRYYLLVIKSNIPITQKLFLLLKQKRLIDGGAVKYYLFRKKYLVKNSLPEKYKNMIMCKQV